MADEPVNPVETTEVKPADPADKTAPGKAPKKKDNTLKIVLIVVGVLVGLGLLATIASIVFFGALFNKATENVDVKDGEVTIQSDDGQSTSTYGENVSLAEGFPSDLPIYEPSTLKASTKSGDSDYSAVATTAKPVTDVTSFYKSEMASQGWTTQYDSSADGGSVLSFQKDNRTASVIVSTSDDSSSSEKTGIVVSVTTQQ